MGLSEHYRGGMTERLGVRIITVDPANSRIEGIGRDASVIQINPGRRSIFRWPIEGEEWTVTRENGIWVLESPSNGDWDKRIEDIGPGEALINASVVYTNTGRRLDQPYYSGLATLVAGQATVNTSAASTDASIFLTAQDNNTVGALRILSRSPGVSFVIKSSNAGDTGVVAWMILSP